MSYTTLRYEVADHILTLTLNRPDQLNASPWRWPTS